jgi:hypothetical protein
MGSSELEGSREMGPVVPLSDEEARKATERLEESAERWRRSGKYNKARARYQLETALLALGLVSVPSWEWLYREEKREAGRASQYGKD